MCFDDDDDDDDDDEVKNCILETDAWQFVDIRQNLAWVLVLLS